MTKITRERPGSQHPMRSALSGEDMQGEPWDAVIDDRSAGGLRVRRDIFSDPDLFELEIRHLFEGGWVYLAHASQLPKPHDYVTTWAGRRPIIIMRDKVGTVRAFHNACTHKGATICNLERGNSRVHTCPYHSWSFNSDGRMRGLKARTEGAYTPSFLNSNHNLVPLARFEQYRGFLFGSLVPDVPTLTEFLGDAQTMLDLVVDQGPHGIEFIPGVSRFTYEGNWKHQLENCSDGYHVNSVHSTYFEAARRRASATKQHGQRDDETWSRAASIFESFEVKDSQEQAGTFQFDNGHVASWAVGSPTPSHPLHDRHTEISGRTGEVRAKWSFYSRNLTIFPNLQIAENFSSQLRILRPVAPGRTEMTTYCIGPVGEAAAARQQRLRQYEDFFMPSGMATPDDLVVYEDCQRSDVGARDTWQSYDRGMSVLSHGVNRQAEELGLKVIGSVAGASQLGDETLMQNHYRAWRERIAVGISRETKS